MGFRLWYLHWQGSRGAIPDSLRGLLLQNPNDPQELATRMTDFEAHHDELTRAALNFGAPLRSRTWNDVAADIVNLASQYSSRIGERQEFIYP